MEQDSSLKSQTKDPQTSKIPNFMLNKTGLKLLQDTTEAVRVAIQKINVFKQYLKEQTDLTKSNQSNIPSISSSIQNLIDFNLQVFFTIPDNKIKELEVREAFEKLGFEDFIITIKNRKGHTFGFIKFSNEDSVTKALEQNLKISLNGQLMKIRPHKIANKNSTSSVNHTEEANKFSQEIDEGLLINVSSGYQNRRILNGYLESKNDQIEEYDENSANIETNNFNSTEAETLKINSFTDAAKENTHQPILPQRQDFVESFSNNIPSGTQLESNQNYNLSIPQNMYVERNNVRVQKFSPYQKSKKERDKHYERKNNDHYEKPKRNYKDREETRRHKRIKRDTKYRK